MTTLHEEPGGVSGNGRERRSNNNLADKEDSHSDPENENTQVYYFYYIENFNIFDLQFIENITF